MMIGIRRFVHLKGLVCWTGLEIPNKHQLVLMSSSKVGKIVGQLRRTQGQLKMWCLPHLRIFTRRRSNVQRKESINTSTSALAGSWRSTTRNNESLLLELSWDQFKNFMINHGSIRCQCYALWQHRLQSTGKTLLLETTSRQSQIEYDNGERYT